MLVCCVDFFDLDLVERACAKDDIICTFKSDLLDIFELNDFLFGVAASTEVECHSIQYDKSTLDWYVLLEQTEGTSMIICFYDQWARIWFQI